METHIVKFHPKTTKIALLHSGSTGYFIGSYSKFLSHQNDLPAYYIISDYFTELDEALEALINTKEDAF